MKTYRVPLRVVLYREEGRILAHCLEFDLIGDGGTQAEALSQLNEAIRLQVEFSLRSGNLDNLFKPAEGKYFRMFTLGKSVSPGALDLRQEGFIIENAETREYEEDLVAA